MSVHDDDRPSPPGSLPPWEDGQLEAMLRVMYQGHNLPSDIGEIVEVGKIHFICGQDKGYFIVISTDDEGVWTSTIVEDITFTTIRSFGGNVTELDALVDALVSILPDVKTHKYEPPTYLDGEPEDDGQEPRILVGP